MDKLFDFEKGGMRCSQQVEGFSIYTNLSWTGKLLLGLPGKCFHPALVDAVPSLELGSVAIQVDTMDGSLLSVSADNGDHDFPYPGESTRLLIVTADPMLYTAPQLRAIADAIRSGSNTFTGLSEVASSQAAHFVGCLREMGIGRLPVGVTSSVGA